MTPRLAAWATGDRLLLLKAGWSYFKLSDSELKESLKPATSRMGRDSTADVEGWCS